MMPYTDMPEKALVSEVIREKMLLNLRDEIPHGIRGHSGTVQGAHR